MENVPIGLIIKNVVQKNNLSVKEIADKLSITRQAVYATYKRDTMHEGEVKKWADALNVSTDFLNNRQLNVSHSQKSLDGGEFGELVLTEIKKMFEEELKEKNEQIKALQKALERTQLSLEKSQQLVEMALGKLHEYSALPVIPEMEALFK